MARAAAVKFGSPEHLEHVERIESTERVKRIIALEKTGDNLQRQSDEARWEAAHLISEEMDAGQSARQLGEAIGKSHTHVLRMRRIWRLREKDLAVVQMLFSDVYRQLSSLEWHERTQLAEIAAETGNQFPDSEVIQTKVGPACADCGMVHPEVNGHCEVGHADEPRTPADMLAEGYSPTVFGWVLKKKPVGGRRGAGG
jgi:hypothetical protein